MNWFSHWDEWIEATENDYIENNKNNTLFDDEEYESISDDDISKLFEN